MISSSSKSHRTITLVRYEDHEMAHLLVDGQAEFVGNYGDFYAGCHGTEIAGYDLAGL